MRTLGPGGVPQRRGGSRKLSLDVPDSTKSSGLSEPPTPPHHPRTCLLQSFQWLLTLLRGPLTPPDRGAQAPRSAPSLPPRCPHFPPFTRSSPGPKARKHRTLLHSHCSPGSPVPASGHPHSACFQLGSRCLRPASPGARAWGRGPVLRRAPSVAVCFPALASHGTREGGRGLAHTRCLVIFIDCNRVYKCFLQAPAEDLRLLVPSGSAPSLLPQTLSLSAGVCCPLSHGLGGLGVPLGREHVGEALSVAGPCLPLRALGHPHCALLVPED